MYILIVQMVSVRVRWEEVERRLKHQTDQYEDSSSKFISFLTRFTGFCNWLSEIHDQLLELCESVPHMASPETIALHTAKLEVLEHCFWICLFVCVCLCLFVHMSVCVHLFVYFYLCVHMSVCMCAFICVCVCDLG